MVLGTSSPWLASLLRYQAWRRWPYLWLHSFLFRKEILAILAILAVGWDGQDPGMARMDGQGQDDDHPDGWAPWPWAQIEQERSRRSHLGPIALQKSKRLHWVYISRGSEHRCSDFSIGTVIPLSKLLHRLRRTTPPEVE